MQRDRLAGFTFGCIIMGLLTLATLTANQHPHTRVLSNSLSAVHSHLRRAFGDVPIHSENSDSSDRSQLQINAVELAADGLKFQINLDSEVGDNFVSDLSRSGSVSITLPRQLLYAAGVSFIGPSNTDSSSTNRNNGVVSSLSAGNTISHPPTVAAPSPPAPSPLPTPTPTSTPSASAAFSPPASQPSPSLSTVSGSYKPPNLPSSPPPPAPSTSVMPPNVLPQPSYNAQPTTVPPYGLSTVVSSNAPTNPVGAPPSLQTNVPATPTQSAPTAAVFAPNSPVAPIAVPMKTITPVPHSPLRGWQPPLPRQLPVSLRTIPRSPYRNYSIFSFPDAHELLDVTPPGETRTPTEEEKRKGVFSRTKPPSLLVEELGRVSDVWPFTSHAAKAAVRDQGFQKTAKRYDWCRDCIDVVIPYVNGSDAWYLEEIAKAKKNVGQAHRDGVSNSRFRDHDEMVYAVRAIFALAPFVRYIHILTNGPQRPEWLLAHPRVHIVNHEAIFRFPEHLPTFNVYSIKQHIHRIPDLAPKFFYMEDDHFLWRGFKLDGYYDFASKNTYLHTAKGLAVTDVPRYDDNSEWLALRKAISLLKRVDPAVRADYPAHVATFLHRDLYRAALETEFFKESQEASAERFRGPKAIETRLLVPVYQKIRFKGIGYVNQMMSRPSELFSRLFDLDASGDLDAEELLGLTDFLNVPLTKLRTLIGGRCPLSMDEFSNLVKPPSDKPAEQYQTTAPENLSPFATALREALLHLESSHSAVEPARPGEGWGFIEMNNEHSQFEQRLVQFTRINDLMVCLNDGLSEFNPSSMSETVMREFLEWSFPTISPVENPVYAAARLDEARRRAAKENRLT